MGLLKHTVAALAGLIAACGVVAAVCWQVPAPDPQSPAPVASEARASPETATARPFLPKPLEVLPEPRKFNALDAAGLSKLLGGAQVVAVVERADRVTSVRLKVPDNPQIPLSSYKEASPEVVIDADTAARVRSALLDPAKIRPGGKPCPPQFGWRLSFYAGARRVDFYFCLECALLVVYLDGNSAGGSAFDPVSQELEEIYRSIDHRPGTVDRSRKPAPAIEDPFADPAPAPFSPVP